MQSEIKMERFTFIRKYCFRDILMLWLMDWALKATIRLFMEILWRLDWFVSNVFQQKKIDSNFSQSFYTNTLYSNQKKRRH
jgi:hypothetical protein